MMYPIMHACVECIVCAAGAASCRVTLNSWDPPLLQTTALCFLAFNLLIYDCRAVDEQHTTHHTRSFGWHSRSPRLPKQILMSHHADKPRLLACLSIWQVEETV